MKYIKIVIYVSLTIFLLFSFSACGKKPEQTKKEISFQEDPDEIINEILSENDEELNYPKDKYKSKLESDSSEKAPNMTDYDFNKELGSEDNSNTKNGKTEHEFKGGVCIHCGIADKAKAYQALSTLIKRDGGFDSDKLTYSLDNKVGDNIYSLIYNTTTNTNVLCNRKYKDKKLDKAIFIDLSSDKKHVTVRYEKYHKNKTVDVYSCIVDANSYTVDTNFYFEDYNGSKKSKESTEHEAKNCCNILMTFFDKSLKDFNSGLTIKDFGFIKYKPIGSKDKK